MRTTLLFCLSLFFLLSSCKRSGILASDKDREAVYQRFNGKYEIVSATASEALDLNFDGNASVDLKKELPGMDNPALDITINMFTGSNTFNEFWPEPSFGLGGELPKRYNPNIPVYYASQGVARSFEFSKDYKSVLLHPEDGNTNLQRYPRPDSILILPGDVIEVQKSKEFYTTQNWKKVQVVIVYKRRFI